MPLIKPKSNKQMGPEADMKEGAPSLAIAFSTHRNSKKKKMAEGGAVAPADFMEDDERAESIAEAIMQKRRKFAEGGAVDLAEESEEQPNYYDELNAEAADAPQYDDDQLSAPPMDSDEDKTDMVSRIRSKLRAKSGG